MTDRKRRASAVEEILNGIEATADASYAHFCAVRTKCSSRPDTVLGIRMGVLRRAMKELVRVGMDYEMACEILLPRALGTYEYKILYGGVMQRVCPPEKVEEGLRTVLSLCDGWATCDFFTEQVAYFAQHGYAELVLDLMKQATEETNIYARRLSIVSMIRLHKYGYMSISEVIDRCALMQDDDAYYIRMGIAWVLAEMYVHDAPSVVLFMRERLRSPQIHRMLIRKLKDSYRVEDYR